MHKPETSISYGWTGFKFYDSKDNDISWELMAINPSTKEVHVEGFKLRNNATDPINAFVAQMQAQAEILRVHGENIDKIGALIQNLTSVAFTMSNSLERLKEVAIVEEGNPIIVNP